MITLSEEPVRLRQADTHVVEALRRIEHQRALLAAMRATLDQFTCHHDAIQENIERLRRQLADPQAGTRSTPPVPYSR